MTASAGRVPTGAPPFVSRFERFERVGSTNDVVRGWLSEGVDEVAIAVADVQTSGRGRNGRTWTAPPGAALLLSAGFRPAWLATERAWRLAAIVALAMADAAEEVAGLRTGTIRLKWPNDLVIVTSSLGPGAPLEIRKVAGVLGETDGLGTAEPRAIIGIGVNADWPAAAFPPELADTMTSLREVSRGRPIDREALLGEFLVRLETRVDALCGGRFDVAGWGERQVTTGRIVRLDIRNGPSELVRARGVDGASGALLVESLDGPDAGVERAVLSGEISHLRIPSSGAV